MWCWYKNETDREFKLIDAFRISKNPLIGILTFLKRLITFDVIIHILTKPLKVRPFSLHHSKNLKNRVCELTHVWQFFHIQDEERYVSFNLKSASIQEFFCYFWRPNIRSKCILFDGLLSTFNFKILNEVYKVRLFLTR